MGASGSKTKYLTNVLLMCVHNCTIFLFNSRLHITSVQSGADKSVLLLVLFPLLFLCSIHMCRQDWDMNDIGITIIQECTGDGN